MYLPDLEIENMIFKSRINFNQVQLRFTFTEHLNKGGDFSNVNWLNTPGPIYTTHTDNCGTGQVEAINNVGGDEDYHEAIFKQPANTTELDQTIRAAVCDPFGSYYFDGNLNWNPDNTLEWWDKSNERIDYIIALYKAELELPEKPHISSWKIGNKVFTGQLYGPSRPIPENYKSWLDFYQHGLKNYLEWYINKLFNKTINFQSLKYDWSKRKELDNLFDLKLLTKL